MAEVASELRGAKERAETDLLALPGVTGVDVGYKEVGGEPTDRLAIRVLVAEKTPRGKVPAKQRVPEEIDGHPTDVIERRFELHQLGASMPVESLAAPVDSGAYDPLRGGISIGPCRVINGFVHAGTLGAIVVDNVTNEFLALSSFHVLCVDDGSSPGDPMAQPARMDGGTCPGDAIGTLRRHALTASVDAAVADTLASGAITRLVAPGVVEIGALTGVNTATLGAAVRKRGRTTRLTFGTVDSVDLTLTLDYGDGIGRRTLTNQIGVKPDGRNPAFTAKGDTGSVVVNDARQVVGLLVAGDDAGYGVANPIGDVLGALNVRLPSADRLWKLDKAEKEGKEVKPEKDLKPEKDELKDLKPENKDELKDHKPETKEGKNEKAEGIDKGPRLKDKVERPEALEGVAGREGVAAGRAAARKLPEFKEPNKLEGKELKDAKGGEKSENKETKFENKEIKDAKGERKEGKDEKAEKEVKDNKGERKELKNEKAEKDEAKEAKDLKGEQKEGKDEKAEKGENKELKNEKLETKPEKDEKEGKPENKDSKELKDLDDAKASKDRKDIMGDVPVFRSEPAATPGPVPIENRVSSLEAAVGQLRHFIEESQRPDLRRGALAGEPDAAGERPPPPEDRDG
jgi:hypothetical protein